MGLDMYLKVRKSEYQSNFRGNMESYPEELAVINTSKDDQSIIKEVSYNVGYWRKANAIHKWIVDNCAGGEDDCRPVIMSKEDVQNLRNACLEVLIDKSKAPQILPTSDGFFFGSTDYDEWYMENIKYTADLLQGVLKLLEKHGDVYDVVYEASW